jgi:hypothetical protein
MTQTCPLSTAKLLAHYYLCQNSSPPPEREGSYPN